MGNVYYKAKELFENELEKLVAKGDVNEKNLEAFDKVIDIIKDIEEICEKEEEMGYDDSYSGRRGGYGRRSRYYPGMGEYYMEGSYAGGYGNSYSNEGSYAGGSRRGGYSREGGRSNEGSYMNGNSNTSSTKNMLYQLMHEAPNDKERTMIQRWIDELG